MDNEEPNARNDQGLIVDEDVDFSTFRLENILPRLRNPEETFVHAPPISRDPWEVIRERVESYDNDLCNGWTDDINTLLVLAGLLTTVVTSFAVDSYRMLQPDSEQISRVLLLQISRQLSNSSIPHLTDPAESFSPSPSAIRINIVWFLSIMLSLSTALIGLLCKQWIKEYQKDASITPRDALRLRHFRREDLHRWKFPSILATLPVFLQMSVLLFFAGALDLLWGLNRQVAIPNTIAVGLSAFFVVGTTLIPGILLLRQRYIQNLQTFSPFKSPQSWLFFRIALYCYERGTTPLPGSLTGGWTALEATYGVASTTTITCLRWITSTFGQSLPIVTAVYHAVRSAEKELPSIGAEVMMDPHDKSLSGHGRLDWVWLMFLSHGYNNRGISKFLLEVVSRDVWLLKFLPSHLMTIGGHSEHIDEELMLQILARAHVMLLEPKGNHGSHVGAVLCFLFQHADHPSRRVREVLQHIINVKHLWLRGLDSRSSQSELLRAIISTTYSRVAGFSKNMLGTDNLRGVPFIVSLLRSMEHCRRAADIGEYEISRKFVEAKNLAISQFRLPKDYFDPTNNHILELREHVSVYCQSELSGLVDLPQASALETASIDFRNSLRRENILNRILRAFRLPKREVNDEEAQNDVEPCSIPLPRATLSELYFFDLIQPAPQTFSNTKSDNAINKEDDLASKEECHSPTAQEANDLLRYLTMQHMPENTYSVLFPGPDPCQIPLPDPSISEERLLKHTVIDIA